MYGKHLRANFQKKFIELRFKFDLIMHRYKDVLQRNMYSRMNYTSEKKFLRKNASIIEKYCLPVN